MASRTALSFTAAAIELARFKSSYGPWIAGREVEGLGEPIPLYPPHQGLHAGKPLLATVHSASSQQLVGALSYAQKTFDSGIWSRRSANERADVLSAFAQGLAERLPELVAWESLQTGRTVKEMKAQLARLPEWLEYFSAVARTHEGAIVPTSGQLFNSVNRVPLGVVAQITPCVGLAAGNSVVVKPSELAPLSVLELGSIAKDAGVPDGVLSILPGRGGSVGKGLISSPLVRKVDLTGGTETGRRIGGIAGANLASYTAELGGKAPVIVFDDANLQSAVNGCAFAAFIASGQTCVAGTRFLVRRIVLEPFLEYLQAKIFYIQSMMGDPLNPASLMGPVVSDTQLRKIEELVASARSEGATVLVGGERMTGASALDGTVFSEGYFYPPTVVIDVKPGMRVWNEELFGPVVVVTPFDSEGEAIELANTSEFGLGAGIWTKNGAKGLRVAEQVYAGICWINTHHRNSPSSPWGGTTAGSGLGRENGLEAYKAYTQSKSLIIDYADESVARTAEDWFGDVLRDVRYG